VERAAWCRAITVREPSARGCDTGVCERSDQIDGKMRPLNHAFDDRGDVPARREPHHHAVETWKGRRYRIEGSANLGGPVRLPQAFGVLVAGASGHAAGRGAYFTGLLHAVPDVHALPSQGRHGRRRRKPLRRKRSGDLRIVSVRLRTEFSRVLDRITSAPKFKPNGTTFHR
jgi:hypothetical protein